MRCSLLLLCFGTASLILLPGYGVRAKHQDAPKREKALESKDAAKIFGAEAWKKVSPAAERLFKEKATDFVIETVEAKKEEAEKLRGMKAEEKEKYFHELVTARVKMDKVQGVYILIYKSPTYLYVGTTGDAHFPTADASMIRQTLLAMVRDKKFDDALGKVLQIALEAKKLEEKK